MERTTYNPNDDINSTGNQNLSYPDTNLATHIVFSILLSIILIIAFLGNLFMLATLRKCHSLSIVSKLHVSNLASANLIKAGTIMPLNLYTILQPNHSFGHAGCEIIGAINMVLTIAANMSLAAVAFDRYYASLRAMKYASIFTKRNGCYSVITIWMLAFLVASLPLIRLTNDSSNGNNCFYEWSSNQSISLVILLVINSAAYLIPLIILIICYLKIKANVITARQQLRKMMKQKGSYSTSDHLELRSSHSDQPYYVCDDNVIPSHQISKSSKSPKNHDSPNFWSIFSSVTAPFHRRRLHRGSTRLKVDTSASDEVVDQIKKSSNNQMVLPESNVFPDDNNIERSKTDTQTEPEYHHDNTSIAKDRDDSKTPVSVASTTIALTDLKDMAPVSRARCVTGTSMISTAIDNFEGKNHRNNGQLCTENESPSSNRNKAPTPRYRYRARAFRRSRILLDRLASIRSKKHILVNVKVLRGNIISMIICWTPFTIILTVSVILNSMAIIPAWIKTVTLLFTYTNAALNPIIHTPRVKHAKLSKLANQFQTK
ncbi:Beta-2 adrenergic receptor [Trichoplax sp. H2]|nr:Beta-2 adrenergic receptor [Trichoplax sp. H2]|eukprot:RDD45914.1 Beta-2 adrenergic receptor [Trichoplax sp. H2]